MIELYRPDLELLQRDDPPFALLQERRCSLREYADESITARQLGEFLFRVARVKDRREWKVMTPSGSIRVEGTTRPFPAGGGLYHELEVYACRQRVSGVWTRGSTITTRSATGWASSAVAPTRARRYWPNAGGAAGVTPGSLQVLLVLASRHPRLAWKYFFACAYALTLKHVGVMYQTMYFAATAMGPGPPLRPGGDSDLFARPAGLDYYAETSVGEFLLGAKR